MHSFTETKVSVKVIQVLLVHTPCERVDHGRHRRSTLRPGWIPGTAANAARTSVAWVNPVMASSLFSAAVCATGAQKEVSSTTAAVVGPAEAAAAEHTEGAAATSAAAAAAGEEAFRGGNH